jgi:hypothetical protein
MAISVDWGQRIINIPQSYLTALGGVQYELDVEQFFRDLRDLEDSEAGMVSPAIIQHATSVTLGGVTYARFVEIINGYQIRFEDTGSLYFVNCVGANHNVADVLDLTWTAEVVVTVGNAAGLIVAAGTGGGGVELTDVVEGTLTLQDVLRVLLAYTAGLTDLAAEGADKRVKFKDVTGTKDRISGLVVTTADGNERQSITLDPS